MTRLNAIRETLDRARGERVSGKPAGAAHRRSRRRALPAHLPARVRHDRRTGGMGNLVDGYRIICTELL